MHVEMHRAAERALREHARAALPGEACGLLVADTSRTRIVQYVPMANTDTSPTRYRIDPVEFAGHERALREEGLFVCGFFHSHPSGPPAPSPADRAGAWPDHLQLILALDGRHAPALTAWYPHASRLLEIPILGDGDAATT